MFNMKISHIFSVIGLILIMNSVAMATPYEDIQLNWEVVLSNYVDNEGRTDFMALKSNRSALDQYVAFIAETSPDTDPEMFPAQADILAYHINTYNALAMHSVLEKDITTGFNSFFKRAGFFKFHKINVGGKSTSLYDYENKVIRPIGDARVHFALNCMVKDCPRLPQEPFTTEDLDKELDEATWEFFSKDKHLRLDHDKKILWVSEILKFYTKDFVTSGKSQDLLAYVNKYVKQKVPEDYKVRFIRYDWTLNQQP